MQIIEISVSDGPKLFIIGYPAGDLWDSSKKRSEILQSFERGYCMLTTKKYHNILFSLSNTAWAMLTRLFTFDCRETTGKQDA